MFLESTVSQVGPAPEVGLNLSGEHSLTKPPPAPEVGLNVSGEQSLTLVLGGERQRESAC